MINTYAIKSNAAKTWTLLSIAMVMTLTSMSSVIALMTGIRY
jgi:hypothetical protein